MKRSTGIWDTLLIGSIVSIAGLCAQSHQAALAGDAEPEGRIVRISPDDDADSGPDSVILEEDVAAEPQYWIGIQGRSIDSPVLRTHLQLAEDMGVVIEGVVPDSPAAKAGLRKHDVLLRANGDGVDNMRVLQQHVLAGKNKPIELKIIRLGKEENIVVVPEERPQEFNQPFGRALRERLRGLEGGHEGLQQLLEQLHGHNGFGGAFRNFGPGIVLDNQWLNVNKLPNGASVSIRRENNGPAQITVERGDQTWNIVGDDPESLGQLPEDLRPFVRQMLRGQGVAWQMPQMEFDFNKELENVLPRVLGRLPDEVGGQMQERMRRHERQLTERLERLEQRMRKMQGRLENQPAVGDVQ